MGKNWASIVYNMSKPMWGDGDVPPNINLEKRTEIPNYVLDEIKKHQEIEEGNLMYVIPRR